MEAFRGPARDDEDGRRTRSRTRGEKGRRERNEDVYHREPGRSLLRAPKRQLRTESRKGKQRRKDRQTHTRRSEAARGSREWASGAARSLARTGASHLVSRSCPGTVVVMLKRDPLQMSFQEVPLMKQRLRLVGTGFYARRASLAVGFGPIMRQGTGRGSPDSGGPLSQVWGPSFDFHAMTCALSALIQVGRSSPAPRIPQNLKCTFLKSSESGVIS